MFEYGTGCPFSKKQIDILRTELFKVYKTANKNSLKSEPLLSWTAMAQKIEEAFENIPLSHREQWPSALKEYDIITFGNYDNLRKFAVCLTNKMAPHYLIALKYWLTSIDCPWSALTDEFLYEAPITPKISGLFADFLYENCNIVNDLLDIHFTGDFLYKHDDLALRLTIEEGTREDVMSVTLKETYRSKNKNELGSSLKPYTYSGWVTIAPDGSLFCILKHDQECSNNLFIPMGIEKPKSLAQKKIENIYFINRPTYYGFDNTEMNEGKQYIVNKWLLENENNILLFHSVK